MPSSPFIVWLPHMNCHGLRKDRLTELVFCSSCSGSGGSGGSPICLRMEGVIVIDDLGSLLRTSVYYCNDSESGLTLATIRWCQLALSADLSALRTCKTYALQLSISETSSTLREYGVDFRTRQPSSGYVTVNTSMKGKTTNILP